MALLQPGTQAPDFSLPDEDGRIHRLSELCASGPVVVYFYPKDDTPGCTAEACKFRDDYVDFVEHGARVVGISSDGAEAHRAFKAKHGLPFTLLSDDNGATARAFGVKKLLGLVAGRATFVVDRECVVRFSFSSAINMHAHVNNALNALRELR
ncbi:MAG TPA: peroxiredoxin [Polyangiaceae bacterium]|nr:peroxiredoxin [Polyangiaceae bacterium]